MTELYPKVMLSGYALAKNAISYSKCECPEIGKWRSGPFRNGQCITTLHDFGVQFSHQIKFVLLPFFSVSKSFSRHVNGLRNR